MSLSPGPGDAGTALALGKAAACLRRLHDDESGQPPKAGAAKDREEEDEEQEAAPQGRRRARRVRSITAALALTPHPVHHADADAVENTGAVAAEEAAEAPHERYLRGFCRRIQAGNRGPDKAKFVGDLLATERDTQRRLLVQVPEPF